MFYSLESPDRPDPRSRPQVACERAAGYDEAAAGGQETAASTTAGDPAAEETVGTADPVAAANRVLATVRAAAGADLSVLDADAARTLVRTVGQVESAVAVWKAEAISAAQAAGAPQQDGARDGTGWVKDQLGQSGRQAKKDTALAESLTEMADTKEALAEGRLGREQADQLVRATSRGRLGGPGEVEEALLEEATRQRPEQLAQTIRRAEAQADSRRLRLDERRQRMGRRYNSSFDEDGMYRFSGAVAGPDGEFIDAALQAFCRPDSAEVPDEDRRRPDQRRADGLIAMAAAALSSGEAPTSGGVRPHVVVHMSAGDLTAEDGGIAIGASGQTHSGQAGRRIACDATLRRVVSDGDSQILDVGRAVREWPPAIRAAIHARDGHCRFPGCDMPAVWSIVHHVQFWKDGGDTSVDNGVLLCVHHHTQVHEGGWRLDLTPADGTVTVTSPRGTTHTSTPAGPITQLNLTHLRPDPTGPDPTDPEPGRDPTDPGLRHTDAGNGPTGPTTDTITPPGDAPRDGPDGHTTTAAPRDGPGQLTLADSRPEPPDRQPC